MKLLGQSRVGGLRGRGHSMPSAKVTASSTLSVRVRADSFLSNCGCARDLGSVRLHKQTDGRATL
jgi:hypothetical protein